MSSSNMRIRYSSSTTRTCGPAGIVVSARCLSAHAASDWLWIAVPQSMPNMLKMRRRGNSRMRGERDVGRMEFLLSLRKRGINDKAVLRAMEEVPRGEFVDANFTDAAYADQALPIACGQTISQPYVV